MEIGATPTDLHGHRGCTSHGRSGRRLLVRLRIHTRARTSGEPNRGNNDVVTRKPRGIGLFCWAGETARARLLLIRSIIPTTGAREPVTKPRSSRAREKPIQRERGARRVRPSRQNAHRRWPLPSCERSPARARRRPAAGPSRPAGVFRGASVVRRSSAEPDWKTKPREQDALISVEENSVKAKVEEILAPILAGEGDATDGDDQAPASGAPPSSRRRSARRPDRSSPDSSSARRRCDCSSSPRFAASTSSCSVRPAPPSPSSAAGSARCAAARRSSSACSPGSPFRRSSSAPCPCAVSRTTSRGQADGRLPPHRHRGVRRRGLQGQLRHPQLPPHHPQREALRQRQRTGQGSVALPRRPHPTNSPESEELDALYDRFLLRSSVEQVSAGSLAGLLRPEASPAAPCPPRRPRMTSPPRQNSPSP